MSLHELMLSDEAPRNSSGVGVIQASAQSKYYILDYKYVSDILEKRGPHREAHLDAVRAQVPPQHFSRVGLTKDTSQNSHSFQKGIYVACTIDRALHASLSHLPLLSSCSVSLDNSRVHHV